MTFRLSTSLTQRGLFSIVFVAAGIAFALPLRQPNCNTAAHYALVQSLAHGTARIDRIHGESCDISWWHHRYYANKAPGLALVTLPWYEVVRMSGLMEPDARAGAPYPAAMRALPRRDLWLMGLWAAVLPALGLLVLVRRVAERLQPGSGTAAAAVLAFGSLLLPFSSVFFSHALAAFLGFGAFALLLRRPRTAARAGAAGLLAGAGVLVEYPSAILAALLGVYVLRSAYPVSARVGAAFASGAALGPACLLVFNQLAYGSPFHLSYVGAVLHPGASGHDVLGANSTGFFGVTVPKLHRLTEILIGSQGLLTLGPVLTLVPVGWLLLWRRGLRQESALLATVVAVFVFYNVCYYSPLGGATPGPRFLIVALPFAVAALAPVLVRFGWQTLVLTAPSVVFLVSAHLTQPLISKPYSTEDWWTWIREGSFTMTVLRPGSHTLLPVVPIMLAAASALAGAALSLQRAKLDAATTNAAGPQYTGDPRRAQGGG